MIMRTEIYELYKSKHSEELRQLQALAAYEERVKALRTDAQEEKLAEIAEWERRLADE